MNYGRASQRELNPVFSKFHVWWHTRNLRPKIRRHGWTGVYVGDYHSAPTWAYSVGFDETLGQPEIIVFDLPQAPANEIFWMAFTELKQNILTLEDGKIWETVGHTAAWRKVHPSHIDSDEGWLTLALFRRAQVTGRTWGLEAFQLVLSDEAGFLPWQEGYDERIRPRQPQLYLPREGPS
jgi:hypothetical protein